MAISKRDLTENHIQKVRIGVVRKEFDTQKDKNRSGQSKEDTRYR